MSQIPGLLNTLKSELRARGVTYAQVAQQLDLSESSVKRQFSQSRISLERLEQICHLIGLEISDLVQRSGEQRKRISMLTQEQEAEVAGDPRLLLVATCVLNQWTYEEILYFYELTEHECVQLLAKLDRLEIIELMPLNRVKVSVASDFRWLPGGPIQQFFLREVQPDFLQSHFTGAGEKLLFRSGMLSRATNATMLKKMDHLMAEFNDLHEEDRGLPLDERFGTSLLIALRPWEFSYFSHLRREKRDKVF